MGNGEERLAQTPRLFKPMGENHCRSPIESSLNELSASASRLAEARKKGELTLRLVRSQDQ